MLHGLYIDCMNRLIMADVFPESKSDLTVDSKLCLDLEELSQTLLPSGPSGFWFQKFRVGSFWVDLCM